MSPRATAEGKVRMMLDVREEARDHFKVLAAAQKMQLNELFSAWVEEKWEQYVKSMAKKGK